MDKQVAEELGVMLLVEAGDPSQACYQLDKLIDDQKDDNKSHSSLLVSRGICHQRMGDLLLAKRDYKLAIKVPNLPGDSALLGRVCGWVAVFRVLLLGLSAKGSFFSV